MDGPSPGGHRSATAHPDMVVMGAENHRFLGEWPLTFDNRQHVASFEWGQAGLARYPGVRQWLATDDELVQAVFEFPQRFSQ